MLLADKTFRNYNSSLLWLHTANQSFFVFYQVLCGLLPCHSTVLLASPSSLFVIYVYIYVALMQVINELCGPSVCWSWPILVSIWTKLWTHFSVWANLFHSVIMSRPALQTAQTSIWRVLWAVPAGVKMLESTAYHSPAFSVKFLAAMKSYLHSHTFSWNSACLCTESNIYSYYEKYNKQVHIQICAFILITNSVPSCLFWSSSGRWYWRMYYIEHHKTLWCAM